jgi:hypothetical protein
MPQAAINPDFNAYQPVVISIAMPAKEWDELGAALARMKGKTFQTTADAILAGLFRVGYFKV